MVTFFILNIMKRTLTAESWNKMYLMANKSVSAHLRFEIPHHETGIHGT